MMLNIFEGTLFILVGVAIIYFNKKLPTSKNVGLASSFSGYFAGIAFILVGLFIFFKER